MKEEFLMAALKNAELKLIYAKEKFEFYEQQHRAKKTPSSNKKADVNRHMADQMQASVDQIRAVTNGGS